MARLLPRSAQRRNVFYNHQPPLLQVQTHDEGSCWLPAVLRPAMLLTHWGRTDRGHRSNTGYGADNYTYEAA